MLPPSPNLVLHSQITRNLTNEILTNCIIKGGPLGDNYAEILTPCFLTWSHHSLIQMGEINVDIFIGSF